MRVKIIILFLFEKNENVTKLRLLLWRKEKGNKKRASIISVFLGQYVTHCSFIFYFFVATHDGMAGLAISRALNGVSSLCQAQVWPDYLINQKDRRIVKQRNLARTEDHTPKAEHSR